MEWRVVQHAYSYAVRGPVQGGRMHDQKPYLANFSGPEVILVGYVTSFDKVMECVITSAQAMPHMRI